MSASTASDTVVTQLVETLRALAGSHPGFRAAHAKGIVCAGTFRPSADARRMTRAAHLQGGTVPTIVRFSRDERRLVFDPANRTDGIELSNDPLPARPVGSLRDLLRAPQPGTVSEGYFYPLTDAMRSVKS